MQLWEQNAGLLSTIAWEYYAHNGEYCRAAGVTLEDLQQESFFVVLGAARAYNPAKEVKLTSYFPLQAKHRFNEITGRHGRTPHPLNVARSLEETPGTDAEDVTIGDMTEDPAAAEAFEDADERVRNDELHAALLDALERCSEPQQEAIMLRYFHGRSQREAAAALGITDSAVKDRVQAGINRIRRSPVTMKLLRSFVEYGAAYNATGWASWNRSGSVEERLLERAWMKHERAERQAGN